MTTQFKYLRQYLLFALVLCCTHSSAQTEMDAIMMNKQQFCAGPMYTYSSWDQYWEGTFKRENLNLGKVSSQSVMPMATYGIKDNLNAIVAASYVWTKASAGTLAGFSGIQDISVWLKWRAFHKVTGKNAFSVFGLAGFSAPLTDYVVDYLPLSIGMGTTNLTARLMADYQREKISVTGSAAYIFRSNVKLDRTAYYDTEMHLTNEVKMPDAMQFQLRSGYRGKYLLAEAVLTNWTTLGGFDITKNNMPFPSNRMNSTAVGIALKYTVPALPGLAFMAGANQTIAGRNVGQSLMLNAGVFYGFYFGKKQNQKN